MKIKRILNKIDSYIEKYEGIRFNIDNSPKIDINDINLTKIESKLLRRKSSPDILSPSHNLIIKRGNFLGVILKRVKI